MKRKILFAGFVMASASLVILSCEKELNRQEIQAAEITVSDSEKNKSLAPAYDLNVKLFGEGKRHGQIQFRQDPDPAKIITLDTKVHHLDANSEYLLQRAVDAANVVDGNCTSTTWLTLGKGLVPQSIFTDKHGKGEEELWRNVSAVPSGTAFDIHFRVIDAATLEVVLISECYQYQVR